ncbi:MAG: alpha/beta fold hydrolase [Brevundimonas sp.]|uniref:alpha/beta hydrolase n=1 Tax=Brevundimonas sp. TaxID=1871086 RepID=UPI00120292C1|nr:alpha/beta fold hydrolase [Brevundimonas sp.]RZJ18772.1 MAG: alpha/beta fold hydrolase [Brevundimonas sp.]
MLSLALAAALIVSPTETPVTLPAQPAALHGTLMTPDGAPRAAAIMLPGSGPTDRNGDSPLGVRAANMRLLAEALGQQGIASIRYDKRGIGESQAAGTDEADLRFDDMATDARGWAAQAVARTGLPCAWLIGHSEGALVALVAAQSSDTPVCGLVLIAGAGRPAGEVLREQLNAALPDALKPAAMSALDDLEAGRPTEAPAALAAVFRPSVQPYLMSWLPLDPARLAAEYDGPILIVQGDHDLQIPMSDAERVAAAQPHAELVRLAGVNHVLKVAPAERAGNLATYGDPDLPLAPGVAETVGGFILKAAPAAR